jgi:hypothetical protein
MRAATNDSAAAAVPAQAAVTRLNVNLNSEAAAALHEYVERRNISYTEAIRRAVALLKFVDDQISSGHEIQVTDGELVYRIVLES